MTAAGWSRTEVVQALRPERVLAHFGVPFTRVGDELRVRLCPVCGPRRSDAVVIHRVSGAWCDLAHGCSGDVLRLVAGFAGLDSARDLAAVLAKGAELAGLRACAGAADT